MQQATIPEKLPSTFVVFPTEIANRIHFHFYGNLMNPVFIPRPGWYVSVERKPQGISFRNNQEQLQ